MSKLFQTSEIFAIVMTLTIYLIFQKFQSRYKYFFLSPVFMTIVLLIVLLKLFNIPYETCAKGGNLISFLFKPAIVALGVPLYFQIDEIKKQKVGIIYSSLAGCIVGILSVMIFAKLFGCASSIPHPD